MEDFKKRKLKCEIYRDSMLNFKNGSEQMNISDFIAI